METYWQRRTTSLCSAYLLALGILVASPVLANPQDGNVSSGNATITESGAKLNVHQHTDKAIIDWRSFNIDGNEHTQFHQPSSSATVLNRVNSNDPSRIAGKLSANGNVILVNPNGVFFEDTSQVDVNGLIATTADIDNADFMNGNLNFNKTGAPNALVANAGTITAKEAGLVGLVAPNVENHGVINAKLGKVQMASGDKFMVDMYGDGLFEISISDDVTSQLVANTGSITAEGGTIAITAASGKEIVNSLVAIEGELKAPTIEKKGGKVVIAAAGSNAVADNKTEDKGKKQGSSTVLIANAYIDASGRDAGEQGGTIEITADNIGIMQNTLIDASGHSASTETSPSKGGTASMNADKTLRREEEFLKHENRAGGSIKIGGDYLGSGETATANYVYVDPNSVILNDAIESSDAGRTIIWSDNTTQFYGNVFARGGVKGGHGGFLETSGKVNLTAQGYADLTASEGYSKGTYLLDPSDIAIYGNVEPEFVSTDMTVDLASNLQLWLDAADYTQVTLTYSLDNLGAATASGTIGTNTIITSADVGAELEVGARIRLSGAGAVTTADNLGADTYTITDIAGTTITVQETLTATYAADTFYRGLVSQWSDKAGTNHATQVTESRMPLWVDSAVNSNAVLKFDGMDDHLRVPHDDALNINSAKGVFAVYRWDTSATWNSILGKDNWGANQGWALTQTAADKLDFYDAGNAMQISQASTAGSINLYSALATATTIDTYLNGGSKASGTLSFSDSIEDLFIGDRNDNSGGTPPAGSWNAWNGLINEILIYDRPLSTNARNLIEQHQSVKWNIELDPLIGTTTEVAEATASIQKGDVADGFSAFTTRYLEKLSTTADIVLHADNAITLDLKGDTLTLADDKNITLRTNNGDITDVSAGSITTNRTVAGGNIAFDAGGLINLDSTVLATGGGDTSFNATNGITLGGTTTLTLAGGDATFNDQLTLANNLSITSTGSTVTLGEVDGMFDLSVDAGAIITNGPLGQTIALNDVSLTSASTVNLSTIEASNISVATSAGDIGGAGALITNGGDITLNAANDLDLRNLGINSNGNLVFNAAHDVHLSTWIDAGMSTLTVNAGNDITLTTGSVSAANLAGYWNFDEGTGGIAGDSAGSNDGTVTGAAWSAATPFSTGKSLSFDGANDYVEIMNSASILPTNAFTYSLWARTDGVGDKNPRGILISKNENYIDINYEGNPMFSYRMPFQRTLKGGSVAATGVWTHYIASYDGNVASLYLNGTLVASSNRAGAITDGGKLYIGRYNGGGGYHFNGLIDDVRIYDKAISEFEAAALGGNPKQWNTGMTSLTAGNNITISDAINVGVNTLNLTATAGNINTDINTLTADTINFDAGGTITADVAVTSAIDIAHNATAATLTGTLGGLNTQTEANLITGGPGNDASYTFEDHIIRYAAPEGGGSGGSPVVTTPTVDDTDPEEPDTPPVDVVEDTTTDNGVDIPNTVEINSQKPTVILASIVETAITNTPTSFDNSTDTIETVITSSDDSGSEDIATDEELEQSNTDNVRKDSKQSRKLLGGLVTIHPALVKLLGLEEGQGIF